MRHPHCCACEAARRRHGVGRGGGRRWLDGFAMCTSLLLMREGQERPLPHFLPHHFPRPGGVNKEPFDRRAIKKAPLNNEGTDHSISQKEPPPPTPPDPLHTRPTSCQKIKKKEHQFCVRLLHFVLSAIFPPISDSKVQLQKISVSFGLKRNRCGVSEMVHGKRNGLINRV